MSESEKSAERDVDPDAGRVDERSDRAEFVPDSDPEPSSGSKFSKDEKDHGRQDYGP